MSPHVAACAALVRANNATFTPDQIEFALVKTALDYGDSLDPNAGSAYWDDHFGNGRLSCGPALTNTYPITANSMIVHAGASGGLRTTTICWNTIDGSNGEVWVKSSGGTEQLFAQSASGCQNAPWIQANNDYWFTLYKDLDHQSIKKLGLARVTRPTSHTIKAYSDKAPGNTRILWANGLDDNEVEVWVSLNGGGESLFGRANSAVSEAPWINDGNTYVFRLYTLGKGQFLGSVTVVHS